MIFLRSLLREFANLGVAVFLSLFLIALTTRLIRLLGQAAGGRIPSDAVVAFLGFSALNVLPVLLSLTLFITVLLALNRAWRDSEMVIWFGSGLSLTAWMRPVLIFAAPLVFVGEGPGADEDAQGEPFVGQAGKLLDSMLAAIRLKRGANVYIANIVKCRPPGNRNPEPGEALACEPYLHRQINLIRPKLIVALGKVAAANLLASDASVASMRGKVHDYRGTPLIVTYHPAYLLRSLPEKAKAWADLCFAVRTMGSLRGGKTAAAEKA